MQSRRTVLKGGVTLACASLAGCIDGELPGSGPGDHEGSGRHYDAGAAFDAETAVVASADVQAVLDAPVPETVFTDVDRVDDSFESVEPSDFDSLDVSAFYEWEEPRAGVTAVMTGGYDVEGLRTELRDSDPVEAAGEYRGTERYQNRHDAVALTDKAVVFGGGEDDDTTLELVDRGLDALEGDGAAFDDRANGATLLRELSGDVTVAVDFGADLREEFRSEFDEGAFGALVDATAALGIDATFDGAETDLTYVFVADEGELDVDTVRTVADLVEDSEESSIENVSVSSDGRAIVASADVRTRDLFEAQGAALDAVDPEVQTEQGHRTAPHTNFDFDYHDGVLDVTHDGGDAIPSEELYLVGDVDYRTGDGSWATTGGISGRVAAGYSVAVGGTGSGYAWAGSAGEGTVRVIWADADGGSSATLQVWER